MTSEPIKEALFAIPSVMEEIGALCNHLREALNFVGHRSPLNAAECGNDAIQSIDSAISELSAIRDKVVRWTAITEEEANP